MTAADGFAVTILGTAALVLAVWHAVDRWKARRRMRARMLESERRLGK